MAGSKLWGGLFGGGNLEVAIGIFVIRHTYLIQLFFGKGVWAVTLHRLLVLGVFRYTYLYIYFRAMTLRLLLTTEGG